MRPREIQRQAERAERLIREQSDHKNRPAGSSFNVELTEQEYAAIVRARKGVQDLRNKA